MESTLFTALTVSEEASLSGGGLNFASFNTLKQIEIQQINKANQFNSKGSAGAIAQGNSVGNVG